LIFGDGFESGDCSSWSLRLLCGSDANCLEQVGSIDFSTETGWVSVKGGYAYTTGYNFLRLVDVSDPAHPVETGSLEGLYGYFEVAGRYIYATFHDLADLGFRVVDISDTSHPVEIGSLFFGELPRGLACLDPSAVLLALERSRTD
jgi:hypothetical protein